MFSSTSLAVWLVNSACLLGCYSHSLWDTVEQVLSAVQEEAQAMLSQAVADRRDSQVHHSLWTRHCRLSWQNGFVDSDSETPRLVEDYSFFWGCEVTTHGHAL